MNYCEEGFIISIKQGYWRPDNESDYISDCGNL